MFFFLPIGTTRPCWRAPWVTYLLILLNIVVFGIQIALGERMPEGFVPAHPNPLMWVLATFMHGGLLHLAGNMLFLWLFATIAEDVLGPGVLLGFYFAANFGASLLHGLMGAVAAPGELEVPVIGASGAIAGIMGLASVCFMKTKVRVWYLVGLLYIWRTGVAEIAAPVFLGLWAGWEVMQGLLLTAMQAQAGAGIGGVAHWAHVGGFAVGLAGALLLGLNRHVARTDAVEGRTVASSEFGVYEQRGDLEQMVQKTPDDAELWHALAQAREQSGSPEVARQAYAKSLELSLRQGNAGSAVAAWRALTEEGQSPDLPVELLFPLARALDECGQKEEAFHIYHDLALDGGAGPRTETSLVRAGEIALTLPAFKAEAATFFLRLMRDFAYGAWRDLALTRLSELGVDPNQASDEAAQPSGPAEAAATQQGSADDPLDELDGYDPYGMGAATVGDGKQER